MARSQARECDATIGGHVQLETAVVPLRIHTGQGETGCVTRRAVTDEAGDCLRL